MKIQSLNFSNLVFDILFGRARIYSSFALESLNESRLAKRGQPKTPSSVGSSERAKPSFALFFSSFFCSFRFSTPESKSFRQPVYKNKQAAGQVFYSWALNLDRLIWTGFFGPYFRQEGKIGWKDRKHNLAQVLRKDRVNPVQLENLSQDLFREFSSYSAFLSENYPKKPVQRNLSRFRAQE